MGKSGSQKRRREAEAAQEQVAANAKSGSQPEPPSKKARVDEQQRTSLFVRSLPPDATKETLAEFFSQHFPIKHATVVLDTATKVSRGFGFVTFTDAEDALQAKEKLNNELFSGRRLKLEIAEPRHRASAKAGSASVPSKVAEEKRKREEQRAETWKPNKLIVRNLPWSIRKSDQLADLFRSYGKVKFADVPGSQGKQTGFGFVTFRGKANAEKAINGLNGKEVDGRTIAVDWAVDKNTWEQQNQEASTEVAEPKKKKTKTLDTDEEDNKPRKASNKIGKKSEDDFDEDEDLRNFMESHMDTLEEEELSDEDDKQSKEDGGEEDDEDDEDDEEGGADLDGSSDDGSDRSDGSDDSDSDSASHKKKQLSTDNSSTLFVRNLPFTTTDEQLRTHFAQFGAVRYARVVMDRATEKPAGRGFVCFFNIEDAEACVRTAPRYRPAPTLTKHSVLQDEAIDSEGKYTLEGRVLQVSKAVSKEEATRFTTDAADARNAHDKDKRRLFLLNEGHIRKDSPLYALLPVSEIQLREASARQRKKLIESNPSLHLSLTRLALRNIPRHMGSKELKALARQAVVGFAQDVTEGKREPLSKEESRRGGQLDRDGEHSRKLKRKGIVLQAKVVFESKDGSKVPEAKKDGENEGGGKSRGYGFIEYYSHRCALMGLRWLNGHAVENPKSGKASRIIAEFAIENANVVARRKATEEKFKGGGAGGGVGRDEQKQQQHQQHQQPIEGNKKFGTKGRDANGGNNKNAAAQAVAVKGKAGGKGKGASVKGGDIDSRVDPVLDKKSAKAVEAKLAMRQKIIGRKRMMRKKKAVLRRGK